MPAFDNPNYTQVPNDLFETYLAQMGEAELRVVLALIRQTLGFHRESARYSLTDLEAMTGLTRRSVMAGTEQAVEHGYIAKSSDGGVTQWTVCISDSAVSTLNKKGKKARQARQSEKEVARLVYQPGIPSILSEGEVGYQTRRSGIPSIPPSIKERNKEDEKQSAKESDPLTPAQRKHYHLPIGEEPSPAVKSYLEAANNAQQAQTPSPMIRAEIDAAVTDLDKWHAHLKTWAMHGYRFANVADLLESYKTGLRSNGHGRDANSGLIKSPSNYIADG